MNMKLTDISSSIIRAGGVALSMISLKFLTKMAEVVEDFFCSSSATKSTLMLDPRS
jgi:hypothetical protein